jgi:chitodextrinase
MTLSLTMAMIMVFSSVINVFADVTWSGTKNYVTAVSFNGGHSVAKTNPDGSPVPLDTSSMTSDYQSVPVDATFTLTTNMSKVFLFRGSYDPNTGTFSDKISNRDLVQIQDSNGNPVSDVTVSNQNDPDKMSVMDETVQVHPNTPLAYDTNYKLVLKKYFDKSNQKNTIQGVVMDDVVIPFKTEALAKPTVTKAELRGNILTLEGLAKNKKLEYNLTSDGNFRDANWKAFDYTDDTANIEVSGVSLTANSKVKVGYAKNDNSTPTDISDPITVLYASASGPSFTGAVLNGSDLVLNGLPKNAGNLEYRIAADGQSYGEWKPVTSTGTSATVSSDGINLVEGKSMIQVRYKASAPWSASDATQKSFFYGLGTTAPLEQGKETVIDEGIKVSSVSLNTPGAGEANTVTVRNSLGEKYPMPDNMGFAGDIQAYFGAAGGVYGFNLKGSGSGEGNHVKVTIPYKLPAVYQNNVGIPESDLTDSSKVSIYMLVPLLPLDAMKDWKERYQTWQYIPTTIDSINKTATVDISNFGANGKDVILAVKQDRMAPSGYVLSPYSKTSTAITLRVGASDPSDIKEFEIERKNIDNPEDKKTVVIYPKDYQNESNQVGCISILYTDNDLEPGVKYQYSMKSVTDMIGNKIQANKITFVTLDSMKKLVQETKEAINNSLQQSNTNNDNPGQIVFAPGDGQNSVTQNILLPIDGIFKYGDNNITWTSDRPDVLKIINGSTEIHPPVDVNGNPIKDGVTVTLTGTINYSNGDGVTNKMETATDTVKVPLTVKWNIEDSKVVIGNEFLSDNYITTNNYELNTDPTIDINTAAKFYDSTVNTIVFKHSIRLRDKTVFDGVGFGTAPQNYVIDARGKTIKADFDGALFNELQHNAGSFTLKNAVIDMNHKTGPILSSMYLGNKIMFDNVKVINAENCQYGVMLQQSNRGSFTANNCEFPSFKVAAIAVYTPLHSYTSPPDITGKTYTTNYSPIPVDINNCTFDGGGKPGYGILNTFGDVSINNSTFKGYKGNVNTGWNVNNDSFDFEYLDNHDFDDESNNYFPYKGLPDGSPSAAVFVKELGLVNLSKNTIADSDNSILAWTGEKNFNFFWKKPEAGFVAYPTVNGIKVDSTTAVQAVDNVINSNTIVGVKDSNSNQVLVQDASDRYNRTTLLAKTGTLDTTVPTWSTSSKVEASKVTENSLTLSWSGVSDNLGVTAYKIYKDDILIGTVNGNITSYDVTGLNPNTEYTFKVEAVDGGNNAVVGPSTKVKTVDTTAPTWSVSSAAKTSNVTENSASISWDKAQDNVGVTAYKIYKNDVLVTTVDGNTTSYNAMALDPYTEYTFKIEAVDASNNNSTSVLTAKVNAFDTAAPTWSASNSVEASKITENSLTLTWDKATDNVIVKSYKIYKDGKVIGTVDGNTTSYDISGLNPNTEYTFEVEAVDGGDNVSTKGPNGKVKTIYTPASKSVNIESADGSIQLGTSSVKKTVKAKVYDQYGVEMPAAVVNWSIVEKVNGISINSDGILTAEASASAGTITVKGEVKGTSISSTKQFEIKAAPKADDGNTEKVVTDNKTGITVKGSMSANASKISARVIDDKSKIASLDKNLSSAATKTETYKTVLAYDLSLFDDADKKIQPNGSVSVSIPLDENLAKKKLVVFYIDDKGVATKMDSTVANGVITFTTTHFSQYVIAEVVPTTPADTSSSNGGTTGATTGGSATGSGTTNGETTTNVASTTGTTTGGTASGTTSAGTTTSTTSTSTNSNVANPKTGNFAKSMLPILIVAIMVLVALVLVEIRRRKRLN